MDLTFNLNYERNTKDTLVQGTGDTDGLEEGPWTVGGGVLSHCELQGFFCTY